MAATTQAPERAVEAPADTEAPPAKPTNGFAIAALVLGIVGVSILAIIFGHVARSRIKRSDGRETGAGMAFAGLVLGYLYLAAELIVVGRLTWNSTENDVLPKVDIGGWFESAVNWLVDNLSGFWNFIDTVLTTINDDWIATGLNAVPPLVMLAILAALALVLRSWQFALFTVIGMLIIQSMGFWKHAMDSLSLVIVAGVIAMIIAMPLGVLASRSGAASKIIKPIMDFMQTLPAFVYLIPALFFFSVGTTAGIMATIIFAMPPGVRLTELGIRQVDQEMVEAGEAFGTAPTSVLTRIQIPLAMPTIMAGVNQVIMLSLSMVVIAGMVGAGGLGGDIYGAVTNLDIAKGFAGGLAVVILAIYLDRLTAALGDRSAVVQAAKKTARAGR